MKRLFNLLFGCFHEHISVPITPRSFTGVAKTYVTCLDCGKEMPYDWTTMKMQKAS